MDIESIYNAYLKEQEKLRERDKNVFHASSAGSCYRKQMYSYYDYPSDTKDDKSYRLLRLGTIVHSDVESAISLYQNRFPEKDIYIEQKVHIKDLEVSGTFDAGEMITINGRKEFTLYDLKTAAAYKWTTKFGRKQNRVADSDLNYKLQLGTYALGVKEYCNPDLIGMYLIWYNKNTSQMKEQMVSPEWIDKAREYWEEVYEIKEDLGKSFERELEPMMTYGVPMQDWECSYCQFESICPSTLSKKKK
tara:strand:+ start:1166 stop:1909 length:744 start_codon:yes stop_codon:yes gene_type:complete